MSYVTVGFLPGGRWPLGSRSLAFPVFLRLLRPSLHVRRSAWRCHGGTPGRHGCLHVLRAWRRWRRVPGGRPQKRAAPPSFLLLSSTASPTGTGIRGRSRAVGLRSRSAARGRDWSRQAERELNTGPAPCSGHPRRRHGRGRRRAAALDRRESRAGAWDVAPVTAVPVLDQREVGPVPGPHVTDGPGVPTRDRVDA